MNKRKIKSVTRLYESILIELNISFRIHDKPKKYFENY